MLHYKKFFFSFMTICLMMMLTLSHVSAKVTRVDPAPVQNETVFEILQPGKTRFKTIRIKSSTVAKRLKAIVKNKKWNKKKYNKMCLKFVADFWASQGATRSSATTAMAYARQHVVSHSMKNIPVGADVYFNYSKWHGTSAGHIAIYIGNDTFVGVSPYGPKIVAYKWSKVRAVYKGHKYTFKELFWGWGYHGNVKLIKDVKKK